MTGALEGTLCSSNSFCMCAGIQAFITLVHSDVQYMMVTSINRFLLTLALLTGKFHITPLKIENKAYRKYSEMT